MIDLDELLNPISEEKPCGEYLKYEQIYDDIQVLSISFLAPC